MTTLPIENPTKQEHGFEVIKMNLLNLQVCSSLQQDEIEARVNRFFSSGTQNGWRLETEGNRAPVECANGGAKHYLFTC
jgi:hypothetical protein